MQIQQNILQKINTNAIVSVEKILILITLATIVPAFIHAQWITGPLVNAILFLSVIYCGLSGAILVGMIPSVIALSAGLLPAPLAPAVPYIIVSNALMAIIFYTFFRKKNFWLGVALGALLKFGFLYMIVSTIVKLASPQIAPKIAAMLSWPQLLTALAGGCISYIIYKGCDFYLS